MLQFTTLGAGPAIQQQLPTVRPGPTATSSVTAAKMATMRSQITASVFPVVGPNPTGQANPYQGAATTPTPTFQCPDGTTVQVKSQCSLGRRTSIGYICQSDGSIVTDPSLCPVANQTPAATTMQPGVCCDGQAVADMPTMCPIDCSPGLPPGYVSPIAIQLCSDGSIPDSMGNCPTAATTSSAFPMRMSYLLIGALGVGAALALLWKK